jgi:outer membrane protein assembly factor BamB
VLATGPGPTVPWVTRRRVFLGLATDGPVTSGLAVSHGIVYAGGNDYTVRALRASDGIRIWRFTAGGPVASQIAVADGTAYAGSNDSRVYALK